MQYTKFLSFDQTLNLIHAVGPDRTVVVEGENGIGKTALFWALKQRPEYANHICVDPIDCTQLSDGSVWMPDIDRENGVSRELPNERFGLHKKNQRGVAGSRPSLICLDEIAKAPQYIKNVLAPIVYERRVGNFHLVEGSVVFCLTNLSVEGLGDSLQAHLRNRLVMVKMRKPTADEWEKNFAEPHKLHPVVRAFVRMYPKVMESFIDYEPGGSMHRDGVNLAEANGYIFNPRAQQDGYASPRSLHAASDIVSNSAGLDTDTLHAALAGAVGEVTARDMSAFVSFNQQLPDYGRVVKDPMGAPVIDNPTAQVVQLFQFVSFVKDRPEAEAVTKYVRRMRSEVQSMMCNIVANSSKIATFSSVADFTLLMRENHVYL